MTDEPFTLDQMVKLILHGCAQHHRAINRSEAHILARHHLAPYFGKTPGAEEKVNVSGFGHFVYASYQDYIALIFTDIRSSLILDTYEQKREHIKDHMLSHGIDVIGQYGYIVFKEDADSTIFAPAKQSLGPKPLGYRIKPANKD